MRLKNDILILVHDHLITYPTPTNFNYFWGFGSLAGFFLVIQIVSGIFLAMHYTPHIDQAFNSVEHIMRDVNNGWLLRYMHANGASMFFIIVYTHIGRGLYFRSYIYPRQHVWYTGIILFVLLMATAFLGYVLPWGQMSYWGATVITNLFSAIPIIGQKLAYWLWGGYSVDNATLNRFFVLHFILPFAIGALTLVHLTYLHKEGSNNPLGVKAYDYLTFYPYFAIKDFFGFFLAILFFSYLVYYAPNWLGHPDNYIRANSLVTPPHIVPEWYFLPFYAILRAVPDKLGGVLLMGAAIAIYFVLPTLDTSSPFRSPLFRPMFAFFFWFLVADFILLGIYGAKPVEEPYTILSQILASYYFFFFLILQPVIGKVEYSLFFSTNKK